LRNIELRSIELNNIFESGEKSFEVDQSGYWICFERAKQRGLPVVSTFCVPRRQDDWAPTVSGSERNPVDYDPASVIDRYLELLELDLNKTRDELSGPFFKAAHGKGARCFRNVPMGKNLIERVGREFASELFLPNPASFTGHCWRRSCGTNASNSGVNVTTMMAFMGWNTPKTAIGYVSKSRLTSFNMSMFLCNVQRQNKNMDNILEKLKTSMPGQKAKKTSGKRETVKKRPGVSDVVVTTPAKTSNQFSKMLSSSKMAESTIGTREAAAIEAENHSIVSAINDEEFGTSGSGSSEAGDSVLSGDVTLVGGGGGGGGGGGSGIQGSGGGRADVAGDLMVDSRVSSILRNLQHSGDLHLHFHFGSK
jgi:hypothetical protein